MNERARTFVESWVEEYLHPLTYETVGHHSESRADAMACLESALTEGITKEEIEDEFPDLVAFMAERHEKIMDARVDRTLKG